jgi:hypothetical protein
MIHGKLLSRQEKAYILKNWIQKISPTSWIKSEISENTAGYFSCGCCVKCYVVVSRFFEGKGY